MFEVIKNSWKVFLISMFFWIINLCSVIDHFNASVFNELFWWKMAGVVFPPLGVIMGLFF